MMSSSEHKGGYEKTDINANKVIMFFVLGIIVTVIIVIFLLDYFKAVRDDTVYRAVLQPESAVLRDLRARESEELATYKLLDAENWIYRIPIERAKKLLAEEAYRAKGK